MKFSICRCVLGGPRRKSCRMGNDQAVPGQRAAAESCPAACSTDAQAQSSPTNDRPTVIEGGGELRESPVLDAAGEIGGRMVSGCEAEFHCQVRTTETLGLPGHQDGAGGDDSFAASCQTTGEREEKTCSQGPSYRPCQLLAARQHALPLDTDTPLAGLKLREREACESSPPSAMARVELGGGATPLGCSPVVQHAPLRQFYAGHMARSPTAVRNLTEMLTGFLAQEHHSRSPRYLWNPQSGEGRSASAASLFLVFLDTRHEFRQLDPVLA